MAEIIDDGELRLRELKLKEAELAHRKEMDTRSTRFQLSPWTTALIALLTTGITASVGGIWSQRADAARGRREIALREREQQFQIVLKATENRTPEVAAKNLLFFVDIGYLPDPDSAIRRKATARDVPVITTDGRQNPIAERMQTAQSLAAGPAVTVPGVPFVVRNHILLGDGGKPVSVVATPSVSRDNRPQLVVLHSTWTATAAQTTGLMADSTLRGSAHLVIDRDGTVTQMAPFDYATFHAGSGRWNGAGGLNHRSIGIQLVNRGPLKRRGAGWVDTFNRDVPIAEVVVPRAAGSSPTTGWHVYTEAQVQRAAELIRILRAAYPSITEVVTHSDIEPYRSPEPGPAFPLERFRHEAAPRP